MNNNFLFVFFSFFLFSFTNAQVFFKPGYIIDNKDNKTNCLIRNEDWKNNPKDFEYKLTDDSKVEKGTLQSIKEFGVSDIYKFIRKEVKIDRSSELRTSLSSVKEPEFEKEILFLRVLLESKASLYSYIDGNLRRYFYKIDDGVIEQLVYKSYQIDKTTIEKNNNFRQQLFLSMQCESFDNKRFEKINYYEKDLTVFFKDYNVCKASKFIDYNQKKKRDFFNFNVRPRITNSSFSTNSEQERFTHDFGSKTNFGMGLEFELVLPYNNDRWAIIFEPTYIKFKEENRKEIQTSFSGPVIGIISYEAIQLPIGLRRYFFLNKNSRLFLNTSFSLDFPVNSKFSINADNNESSNFVNFDINSGGNFGFGFGYSYKNKFQIEIRTQTTKSLLDIVLIDSKFISSSIIFGYNLF